MKQYRIVKNIEGWLGVEHPTEENTIITEDELQELSKVWEKPIEELMDDLEEVMTINEETKIAIDHSGKTYNAEELVFHTGEVVEFDGDRYILVRQATPDDYLAEKGEYSYTAPAIKIGDRVDEDGWCNRYTIVWAEDEGYNAECGDESLACDWANPYDVITYSYNFDRYNIKTADFY